MEELNGDVGVKGITAPVDIDFNDILDNLDFAIMGAVEVGYGRWSLVADKVYADLGDSQTGRFGWRTDLDLEQYLGNFLVAYEVTRNESVKFGRLCRCARECDRNGPFLPCSVRGRPSGFPVTRRGCDPVIGARLQAELPNHFFIRALGDVGGFDVSSQITWQALAALGYDLTERSSVLLGYRAIGTDYTDGGFTYDVVTGGVILGLSIRVLRIPDPDGMSPAA